MLRSATTRRIIGLEKTFSKHFLSRSFSSVPPKTVKEEKEHPQPFVTGSPQPGEWDENRTDPYFRPKPIPRSNFISAEDFANRPPVGFDGEFNTYQDAMISLSWMDQETSRAIYNQYCTMISMSQKKHNTTSHEYVVRLIAQSYGLTTMRTAGIIQLQHSEEQMRWHNPELLCTEQAKHSEELILANIRDAYKSERLQPPTKRNSRSIPFLEDPVGIHGRGEPDETSTQWSNVDDIYDMKQKLEQANVRDAQEAKIIIDNHMYKEDTNDEEELVDVDNSSRKLVAAKQEMEDGEKTTDSQIPYPEANGNGERRERWKYVAQVVNTRNLKRKQAGKRRPGPTSYTNNNVRNTLVEHNGELRVATVAEAKQTSWKPTRTRSNEYIFEGVKKAWIEKTLKGKQDVWGRAPRTSLTDTINASKNGSKAKARKETPEDSEASEGKTKEKVEDISKESAEEKKNSSDESITTKSKKE